MKFSAFISNRIFQSFFIGIACSLLISTTSPKIGQADEIVRVTQVSKRFSHYGFNHPARFVYIPYFVYFSAQANAETKVSVIELNHENEQVTFKMKVHVTCSNIKPIMYGVAPIEISENFCVSSTDYLNIRAPFNSEWTPAEKLTAVQEATWVALQDDSEKPGVGLNMNTPFAKGMETLCPGIQEGFTHDLTCMAYSDRKSALANLTAEFVMQLIEQRN